MDGGLWAVMPALECVVNEARMRTLAPISDGLCVSSFADRSVDNWALPL